MAQTHSRHAARFELGNDVIHVQLGAPEGPLEIIRMSGKPVQLLLDCNTLDIIEFETRAHAVEEIRILRGSQACHLGG
jgi:hypothetical protein